MRKENHVWLDLSDERMDDFRFWRDAHLFDRPDNPAASDRASFDRAKIYAQYSRSNLREYAREKKAPNADTSEASQGSCHKEDHTGN